MVTIKKEEFNRHHKKFIVKMAMKDNEGEKRLGKITP